MPTPRKGERRKPFMARCVPELIELEGKKPNQAVAICGSLFDNRKKTIKENILDKLDQILAMVNGDK